MASGILLCQGLPALAVSVKASDKWPKRDFLPPIASINPKLVEKQPEITENALEPVALSAVTSPVIHTSPKVNRLSTDISSQFKTKQLQGVLEIQKKVDEADLEHLWRSTVEKNPVIRFSLEKLATPSDLQTKQSSKFLSRTLGLLIQGGTMAATMLPGPAAGGYRNMGTMAVGNALQNLTTGKTQPTPGSLSPTEQIQLAGLIDELKMKLIHNYQDYKNTLQALAQSHELTVKNNNLYSKALSSKNDLAIMAAGTAYYQALMNETSLRQKAKLYRLELERLAGAEAVSTLELAVSVPTNSTTASTSQPVGTAKIIEDPAPDTVNQELPLAQPKSLSSEQENSVIGPELPPALEIGPHLSQESIEPIGPPMPKRIARQVANQQTSNKSTTKAGGMPLPIPDKILEHKENRP
ncbi:MAG: hypothetical protein K0Q50_1511 [Vampirovibrio sp.]|nr:hypothetical protein [Vampirovibrio sp.]